MAGASRRGRSEPPGLSRRCGVAGSRSARRGHAAGASLAARSAGRQAMRVLFPFATVALLTAWAISTLPSKGAPAFDEPEPWGTIKGRVVWAEIKLPEIAEITITKDVDAITAALNGEKLLAENWVVNKD